jgi:glycosyltransferase involved in cell wall biosynthesis
MGFWIIWSGWMLVIICQLVFFLYCRSKLNSYQDEPETTRSKNPPLPEGVSVIVCAHNELVNLQKLLPVLFAQNYRRFEVVVVNDRSTDGTLDYLLSAQQEYPTLKIVWLRYRPRHIRGKKYALTIGIRAAAYDKLLLTDADCLPLSPDWIRGMASRLEGDTTFVLGYSPYKRAKGILNHYIRYETLLSGALYLTAAIEGRPYMGVGRNLAYRKSFFMQQKGFYRHIHITGGDDDLFVNEHATSDNTRIAIAPAAQVLSRPKTNWKEYYRQKKRHLSVGKYYKRSDKLWLGILSSSHLLFWTGLVVLISLQSEPIFVLTGLLLKWLVQFFFLKTASSKLKDSINLALLPILDFLYVIYYIILGISALFSNNTRWN